LAVFENNNEIPTVTNKAKKKEERSKTKTAINLKRPSWFFVEICHLITLCPITEVINIEKKRHMKLILINLCNGWYIPEGFITVLNFWAKIILFKINIRKEIK
jgi:hypothetical protein